MKDQVAVVGLGYVGLPLALALAERFEGVVGYDLDSTKVDQLKKGVDPTREGYEAAVSASSCSFTASLENLRGASILIVTVPTPVDENHNPDLSCLLSSCETVGSVLKKGSVVVFESTVYPGVTEEVCGPALERASGLKQGVDFKLGYSPERMNPGDQEHSLPKVVKVVAGEDAETLERVAAVYESIIPAGIHRASSIKVAEAAKVIENTQRDLNIALMNELAIIFDKMGISTSEVLAAARTKWNFLNFIPGLVGGHCIGVDPYYLTTKAELLGYHPEVILAGRRINDGMGRFVGQKMVKLLVQTGAQIKGARIGVLGVTFKENVSDARNSRVPDIVRELRDFGVQTVVHDPVADQEEILSEQGLELQPEEELKDLDGVVVAVMHQHYRNWPVAKFVEILKPGGVIIDVKAILPRAQLPEHVTYWSL